MNAKPRPCQAKHPERCPYHGDAAKIESMKTGIFNLLNKQPEPLVAPSSLAPSASKWSAVIKVDPVNPKAKSNLYLEVSADSHDELMEKIALTGEKLDDSVLKPLKSGYKFSVEYPTSTADPDLKTKTVSYQRNTVEALKSTLVRTAKEQLEENKLWNEALDKIKDSPEGQTTQGMKGVAMMEALAKFKYFKGDYAHYDVEGAFHNIVNNRVREYTNRGEGIRTHPQFDNNGELKSARFSLDNPGHPINTFTQEQVDRVNSELEAYFKEVDRLNGK